jgi:Restriction endonuclease
MLRSIVKYLYSQITPAGGRVTESALLQESGGGAQREVDILIEHKIAGHDLKIAVECTANRRPQTVDWIDSLIGKYSRLKVNKVVAVSSAGFSNEAERKAKAHGIDIITAEEATKVDWAARIAAEFFTVMTHSNMLLWIGAFSKDGAEISSSKIDPDKPEIVPENIQHKDSTSEKLFPFFYAYFVQHVRDRATQMIDAKIAENWQGYFSISLSG